LIAPMIAFGKLTIRGKPRWNHCFIDDPFSLGKKYDIVNRRDLAGIGIWALGYDNGYQELWDLIAQKFTAQSAFVESDSVFDSGGPAWNYYSNEEYSFTLRVPEGKQISLEFTEFSMEEGFDSLWVFDGPHTGFPLVGAFSGDGLRPAQPGKKVHSRRHHLHHAARRRFVFVQPSIAVPV